MKTIKKRKVYSAEFKAKIGLEALRGEKTINEIGHERGVHYRHSLHRQILLKLLMQKLAGIAPNWTVRLSKGRIILHHEFKHPGRP